MSRALVVGAHPDDIEFGGAGTFALWAKEGWSVRYVIATRGQRGVQDAVTDPDEFGALREEEAREAARICGIDEVTFLDHRDSEVVYGRELQRDLSRQYRIHRPHRYVVMDPDILPTDRFVNHPDHRAVATAALDIVVTGGSTASIFPELLTEEGLEPWKGMEEIWVMGPKGGDEVVDVSDTIDLKVAALRAHASQIGDWDVETSVKRWLAERGGPHGYAYAESFRVIRRRTATSE